MDTVNFGTTLWLVNKAPHPNAAKVFINWVLTKDAQVAVGAGRSRRTAAASASSRATRRSCVPKGAKLLQVDAEENLPEVVKTQDIAKAVIK